MPEIELTGLRVGLPIGAMAAFGVLRICARRREFVRPRLYWKGGQGDWHAVLSDENGFGREQLAATLAADVQDAKTRFAGWPEQIKTLTPDAFADMACTAAGGASWADRERADWIAAFGTELAARDGQIDSTPFDMSMARQRFVADAARLARSLAQKQRGRKQRTAVEEYDEALFGPWRYADNQHSQGWDPTTIKLGAFTHEPPTIMKNAGVRAAVWLAFESLPLFPCFYRGGLRARSFLHGRREVAFCWPVWQGPIGLHELQSLLGWAELTNPEPDRTLLRRRGITAVYRAVKFKPNQYMVTFQPARLAAMAEG